MLEGSGIEWTGSAGRVLKLDRESFQRYKSIIVGSYRKEKARTNNNNKNNNNNNNNQNNNFVVHFLKLFG